MPISGRTLRRERLSEEISPKDVAERMGFSRQTIWTLERSEVVDPERAALYRKALADAIKASREKVA